MSRRISQAAVEFLESYLGEFTDRKSWRNFRCPYHLGERHNFGVNLITGSYRCLGCTAEGSLVDLIRDLRHGQGGPSGWGGGILAKGSAPEWTEGASSSAGEVSRHETRAVSELDLWFMKRWSQIESSQDSISKKMAIEYLRKRRVDTNRWEVGLMDDLPGRVVFPFRLRSQVCYYMGRAFTSSSLKTVNPDVGDGWPGKGEVLFNYDRLTCEVILCEGIFDAISAETELRVSATCLLGKTITEKQKQLLKKAGVKQITVMLDADARPDATKLALELYHSGFEVWLSDWRILGSDPKDPNECDSIELTELYRNGQIVNYSTELRLLAE